MDGEGGAGGSGRDMRAREGARVGLGVEGRGERQMVRRCVLCERGRERVGRHGRAREGRIAPCLGGAEGEGGRRCRKAVWADSKGLLV